MRIIMSSLPTFFLSSTSRRNSLRCSAFLGARARKTANNSHASAHYSTTQGNNNEADNLSILAKRLVGLDSPTVWQEFSPLSEEYKSINLGQGSPEWDPPRFLLEELKRSTDPEYGDTITANQYARSYAHLPLASALRNDYVNYQWKDSDLPTEILHNLDPETNIATATGVTNVLYCALQGLINPGDEVVLLEPYFDIYASQVKLAGGIPIFCPLRSDVSKLENGQAVGASEFYTLDLEELASKITSNTKVMILNSPHNPTGKIFNRKELEGIANIVKNYSNLIVLSDEVYQHIIFDPKKEPHISIATVNDGQIWDQTLTMSSAGKTFACTGWKVGWAIGPNHLINAVTAVQQWCNFSSVAPTQDAISRALVLARHPYEGYDSYYDWLAADYNLKRHILVNALESAGGGGVFKAVIPNGGFFVMAETSNIKFPYEEIANKITPATPHMEVVENDGTTKTMMPRDWALSRWLTTTVGVTAIPPSAFYSQENVPLAADTLRFAFCKNNSSLRKASQRLNDYNFS